MREEKGLQIEKEDLANAWKEPGKDPEPHLLSSLPYTVTRSLPFNAEAYGPLSFPSAYKINPRNKDQDLECKKKEHFSLEIMYYYYDYFH